MRNNFYKKISIILFASISYSLMAIEEGQKVENFRLFDHYGNSHELFYYNDVKALVFLVQGNGCPFARNASERFHELKDMYSQKGATFFMLNSNLQDNRDNITEEAKEFGYKLPILIDETQLIGESLKITRTGEVFVLDPKTWQVVYTGALDDRLTYENQKEQASKHFLKYAFDSIVNNLPI